MTASSGISTYGSRLMRRTAILCMRLILALGRDGYYSTGGAGNDAELQGYIDQLRKETDMKKRAELAVKAQQKAIDEGYLIVAFHKEQSLAMKKGVTGLNQHPTDQHEINVDTDINKEF